MMLHKTVCVSVSVSIRTACCQSSDVHCDCSDDEDDEGVLRVTDCPAEHECSSLSVCYARTGVCFFCCSHTHDILFTSEISSCSVITNYITVLFNTDINAIRDIYINICHVGTSYGGTLVHNAAKTPQHNRNKPQHKEISQHNGSFLSWMR